MKHPHEELIKQWLEDTTQRLREKTVHNEIAFSNISDLICDYEGRREFFIKPKLDEYKHLRKAAKEGQFVEEQFHDGWVRIAFSPDDVIFDKPVKNYRIVDEYKHLRQAIRDGNQIEFLRKSDNRWDIVIFNNINREFTFPVERYRIHDPYQELKEAQEQGKRVIRLKDDGGFVECFFGRKFDFDYDEFTPEQYKIVEDDITETVIISQHYCVFGGVKVQLTKSGIDGKITAEVME